MKKLKIEVCYSPAMFDFYKNTDAVVVIVDILRATTSICTAFQNGVKSIIPVISKDEAILAKQNGFLVAAERNGIKLDFADFGNSPDNFSPENVQGKDIVYSTTNGTKTIKLAEDCKAVVIGSFSNFTALAHWILLQESDVTILCAGWKGRYNIEDSVFAGALVDALLQNDTYYINCDAALAAQTMWNANKHDLRALIDTCAHRKRMEVHKIDSCIDYCLTFDTCSVVPQFIDGVLLPVV